MMSFIFFTAGIVLAAFSMQKFYEGNILDEWDIVGPSVLDPQDLGSRWGLEMPEESFFEFNVSTSDRVRVRIGTPTYDNDTGEVVLTNLIFDQVGTRFTQNATVGGSNTYQVEIKNEGITPVTIWGNVFAKKAVYQTVYPYSSSGTLVALGGLTLLIYGILTKPNRRRSHRTIAHKLSGLLFLLCSNG